MSWNEVEKTKTGGNSFYNLIDGDNKVRLLTDPVRIMKFYDNVTKKSKVAFEACGYTNEAKPRWLCYVIDRKENKLMLAEFPHSIMKQVLEYKNNPEYEFETAPMPYDITINKKGQKLETEYTVIPARQNTEVEKEFIDELAKKTSCDEIKKKWQEKELANLTLDEEWLKGYEERKQKVDENKVEYPDDDINPEDIPF